MSPFALRDQRPIEELNVAFDAMQVQEKVERRRRMVRSRIISLVITVAFLVVIYIWKRDQLTGAGFITLYAVVLAVSLAWFVVALVRYLNAKRELAGMGQGTALRIGRQGVELLGVFAPWPEVQSLAAVKGKVGRSPRFQLARLGAEPVSVPLDHLDVRPATLDLTARAYSNGHHGVDLTALES
ncbi:MAG: hypothetical protein ABWX96_15890 [Propionibacteriaceae bacterium]